MSAPRYVVRVTGLRSGKGVLTANSLQEVADLIRAIPETEDEITVLEVDASQRCHRCGLSWREHEVYLEAPSPDRQMGVFDTAWSGLYCPQLLTVPPELCGDRVFVLALMVHAIDDMTEGAVFKSSIDGPTYADIDLGTHAYRVTIEDKP